MTKTSLKKTLLSVVAISACVATIQTHTFAAITSSIYKPEGLTKNGLVVWYAFDTPNTTSSTSTNKMGTGNDGVNNGFLALGSGKAGEAITFDGGVRNVAITNNASIQLDTLTVSVWLKTSGAGSGSRSIIAKPNAFGMILGGGCADNVFGIYDFTAASSVCSSAPAVNDNQWHNYICTFDSGVTNGTNCYRDGKLILTGTYTTVNHGSNINIGSNAGGQYITGSIDEARIYNRILSSDEIYSLANSSTMTGTISSPTAGSNGGLVGWWTFDGNNLTSATATDVSGNGNDGTRTGTTAVLGKMGQALSFNGTSNYIAAGNAANLQLSNGTVSAWVKTSGCTGGGGGYCGIVTKQNAYGLLLKNNLFGTYDWGSSNDRFSAIAVNDNKWHHLVQTFQSGVTNGTVLYIDGVAVLTTTTTVLNQGIRAEIGRGGTNATGPTQFWNGSIDDARVYNRVLSPSEVTALYKLGGVTTAVNSPSAAVSSGPIVWWNFDGKNLTSATSTDSSGNGNDGTRNVTTPVMGKIGQGMSFDGSSSYVRGKNVINIPKVTLSTWVYLTAYPGSNSLIGGFANGLLGAAEDKELYINSAGQPTFYVFDGAGRNASYFTSLPLNKWVHLVGTADGSTVKLYVNGALVASGAAGNTYTSYTLPNVFAGGAGQSKTYLSQKLDDFRVYDRALSASEVLTLYKLGGK